MSSTETETVPVTTAVELTEPIRVSTNGLESLKKTDAIEVAVVELDDSESDTAPKETETAPMDISSLWKELLLLRQTITKLQAKIDDNKVKEETAKSAPAEASEEPAEPQSPAKVSSDEALPGPVEEKVEEIKEGSDEKSAEAADEAEEEKEKEEPEEEKKQNLLIRKAIRYSLDEFIKVQNDVDPDVERHVVELLCPIMKGPGTTSSNALFEAIRVVSLPVMKIIQNILDTTGEIKQVPPEVDAPYIFWKPFHVLVEILDKLEERLVELKKEAANREEDDKRESDKKLESEKESESTAKNSEITETEKAEEEVKEDDAETSPSTEKNADTEDENASEVRNQDDSETTQPEITKSEDDSEPKTSPKPVWQTPEQIELGELEFFIEFLKEELAREFKIKEEVEKGTLQTIKFEDLCYLFRPEKEVVSSFDKEVQAYKLIGTVGGRPTVKDFDSEKNKGNKSLQSYKKMTPFELDTIYLDFDGSEIGAVRKKFTIPRYDGVSSIHALDVFPINFLDPAKKTMIEERGDRFRGYIQAQADKQVTHKHYAALSLEYKGNREEIDSKVIIDHELAIQINPDWRPNFSSLKSDGQVERDEDELSSAQLGKSSSEPLRNKGCNFFCTCDLAYTWLRLRNRQGLQSARTLITDNFGGDNVKLTEAVTKLSDKLVLLLARRAFGFVLRSRKWFPLDISRLEEAIQDKDGFKKLVLPKGHTKLVESLVQMHTRLPSAPDTSELSTLSREFQMDLIRGKGKGLIILLHGAPGVGKTSTAESVAGYAGRPLFPITCGDIGYDPNTVEENLETNFRLAHKWKCVLLLDEADVFLQKRDKQDLKRNSLVSVFLRVLEYYPGILFLTTNRVGTFDEAFKSRIHIMLHYPPLDKAAYKKVWQVNLDRVKALKRENLEVDEKAIMEFASDNFENLKWNGRQIRNAFQTAVALAEFKALGKKNRVNQATVARRPAKLTPSQFKKVAMASHQFEEYMFNIVGRSDEEVAKLEGNRANLSALNLLKTDTSRRRLFESSESEEDSDSESNSDSNSESSEEEKPKKKKSKKDKKSKSSSKKSSSKQKSSSSKKKSSSSSKKEKGKSKEKKEKEKEKEREEESGSGESEASGSGSESGSESSE